MENENINKNCISGQDVVIFKHKLYNRLNEQIELLTIDELHDFLYRFKFDYNKHSFELWDSATKSFTKIKNFKRYNYYEMMNLKNSKVGLSNSDGYITLINANTKFKTGSNEFKNIEDFRSKDKILQPKSDLYKELLNFPHFESDDILLDRKFINNYPNTNILKVSQNVQLSYLGNVLDNNKVVIKPKTGMVEISFKTQSFALKMYYLLIAIGINIEKVYTKNSFDKKICVEYRICFKMFDKLKEYIHNEQLKEIINNCKSLKNVVKPKDTDFIIDKITNFDNIDTEISMKLFVDFWQYSDIYYQDKYEVETESGSFDLSMFSYKC